MFSSSVLKLMFLTNKVVSGSGSSISLSGSFLTELDWVLSKIVVKTITYYFIQINSDMKIYHQYFEEHGKKLYLVPILNKEEDV